MTVTTQHPRRAQGTVAVDLTDDHGVLSGTVVIRSALNGYPLTREGTGRCVININPVDYGTHTVQVTAKDTRENETTKQVTFPLDAILSTVTVTSNDMSADGTAPTQSW